MASQPILDQTLDLSGQEQYRLCQLFEAPGFVKEATVEQIAGTDGLMPHLFADQRRRLFPLHSKAATWLSSAFFFDKQAELPRADVREIENRLREAAEFLGDRNPDRYPEGEGRGTSHATTWRSYPTRTLPGSRVGNDRLPLRNALEVRAAAEYLHKWRDEFTFADRQKMARKVLQKAARHGAALGEHDEFLERIAGFGGCRAAEAAKLVNDRAKLARAKDPDLAAELEKMAAMILKDPQKARSPHRLAKVAETIDQLDRLLHIREYSDAIPRAEDALFRITRKTAAAFTEQHLSTTAGSVYDRDELARLRTGQVRSYMGDELADAVDADGIHVDATKLAEIVPTLPLGDARLFDQLCKDVGIRTFAKEAGVRQGFSKQDLFSLASAHRPGGAA